MNDPLSKTLEEIRQVAENSGLHIFFGWLAEHNDSLAVHWNEDNGGDWKGFLGCAKAVSASILYLNWAPFEQFHVDDAVSEIESELTESEGRDDGTKDIKKLLNQIRAFETKVGLTCIIDLAFVSNGVVHIYQETADWFDEFEELLPEDEDDEQEERKPVDKATVNKWALALASDPQYLTSKQREYLLEKLAGQEFPKLPIFDVLRRAETIFQADFRQVAEEKLSDEIRQLREQGLNLNAVALKLGISRDRASGLVSAIPKPKPSR